MIRLENLVRELEPLRRWLVKWRALIILFVVLVLIWLGTTWLDRIENPPPPIITWTLASSTQHAEVLWLQQASYHLITANDSGVAFMEPFAGNSLMAIDAKTGATVWQDGLSFEQSDIRGLLADQSTVFTVTTLSVYAYDATSGQLKWSTGLGEGHVGIMSQLDSGALRVYYGTTLYELDAETGKILDTKPLSEDAGIWVSGNTLLRNVPSVSVVGFDRQTGKTLWNLFGGLQLDEGLEPQALGSNILLVGRAQGGYSLLKGICALNLETGQYNWCRPEEFVSTLAVDHQYQLGYAMRSDKVLLTIDLQTGNVLGETRFLASGPVDPRIGSVSSIAVSQGIVVVSFFNGNQTFGVSLRP